MITMYEIDQLAQTAEIPAYEILLCAYHQGIEFSEVSYLLACAVLERCK